MGSAGAGIPGMRGADGGTIPPRLSAPPRDLSLGMPPAKMSPSDGGPGAGAPPARGAESADGGGARAPVEPEAFESNSGFDLSTVTAFLSLAPLRMSPKRASRPMAVGGGGPPSAAAPGGGGGGGGGGGMSIRLESAHEEGKGPRTDVGRHGGGGR